MITPAHIIDLSQLYERTFGSKPYVINNAGEISNDPGEAFQISSSGINAEQEFTAKGSLIKEQVKGINILLPVKFYDGPELLLHMPYAVISMRGRKTIIKTALAERKGSVKEQFNVDDDVITIKGFLIADDKKFPEAEIELFRQLYLKQTAVTIENALTNIFLTDSSLPRDEQRRVVVMDYDLPDVQGGRHARPFVLNLESDTVFTLEVEE